MEENMECSDSETTPNSSTASEAATEQEIPEQDVKTDPVDSKEWFVGKRFESFDDMMEMVDDLKAHDHPLRVFNSQTVEECNKRRAKAN
jgi:hypothetical protein